MSKRCDLHAHTTASDGDLTPTELVQHAAELGLSAVGITDHDTLAGIPEAQRAAEEAGIDLAFGVELSANYSPGTLHILGYFVDIEDEALKEACKNLQGGRGVRNAKILEKLNDAGVQITMAEVMAVAGEDSVGRPHIAQVILEKGYCETRQEVFDKYLAKGAVAYFERLRYSARKSIELIEEAGGVAVLAHPVQLKLDNEKLDEMIDKLVGYGLLGIESSYFSHTAEQTDFYEMIADKYSLVKTGGSDYHGPSRTDTALAVGAGSLSVPYERYEKLVEAAQKVMARR